MNLSSLSAKLTALCDHPGVRRYGHNMVWMLIEKVFRLLLGTGVGIYVARQLGPANFGLLNYAISFATLFAVFTSLGLDSLVVCELVARPERQGRVLGTAAAIKATGAVMMWLAISAALLVVPGVPGSTCLVLLVAAGYFFSSFQVIELYFQARVKSQYIAVAQLIALSVVSGFRLFFACLQYPLWCFALLESVNMVLNFAGYALFYRFTDLRLDRWSWDGEVARKLFRDGWPLLLASLTGLLYLRIDQLMVTTMIGSAANGQYAVAYRLCELLIALIWIICTVLLPSVVGTRRTSLRRYHQRMELFIGGMFYLALLTVIPAMFAGKYAIALLYGPQYQQAGDLFFWYAARLLIVIPALPLGQWMLAGNYQFFSFWVTLIGAVANIALSYLLIRHFGVFGAVWAVNLSTVLSLLAIPLLFRPSRYSVRLFFSAIFRDPRKFLHQLEKL
ncbi:MAG: flippase [Victivallaceae bacterium]